MKGAVLITMATGLSLWNMETQEAVALAPANYENELASASELWEENLAVASSEDVVLQLADMEELRKVRVRQHKIEVRKAKLEQARLKRLAEIQKCCGVKISENDRAILERIVQAEAGDQDHEGKQLVANVILNRVKSKSFPSTIEKVVFSPRQFSPITDGGYERAVVTEDTKKAVDEALNGVDTSQGALYFMDRRYSDSSNVSWFDRCLTRLFQHQGHEFYK